jgi:alpha/beta superfamily hydrolase
MDVGETPVFFSAAGEECFGIFTEPLGASADITVVLLNGGRYAPMGRNRTWVRLAHHLAAAGFPVLRFDYHGVGESTGRVSRFRFSHPFVQDLQSALGWLRRQGHGRAVVLVGTCFGARTILAAAEHIAELRGAVLWAAPLWDDGSLSAARIADEYSAEDYVRAAFRGEVVRRMLDRNRRAVYLAIARKVLVRLVTRPRARRPGRSKPDATSRDVLAQIRAFARRRIPLVFLYGTRERHYEQFQLALDGQLGDIVREAHGVIELRTVEGVLSVLKTVAVQDVVIRLTVDVINGIRDRAAHGNGTRE